MLRLSVTDIDSYLYWRSAEDMDFEVLLKRLRGQEAPTPAMVASRAFHKCLEDAEPGVLPGIYADGWDIRFVGDFELAIPPIRELKAEEVFQTPSGPVTLVGKVDSLDGLTVHDYKLSERFDPERYVDSYQWRCYLTMFGAKEFVYDVFLARYDEPKVTVYDYHRLPFYAYPRMRSDVERMVSELAEIVAKYVPEKRMAA